jgi:hypothetical protein
VTQALNLGLSAYPTLSASFLAMTPAATGTAVQVRFMVQGSNGVWYSSPYHTLPTGTRTTVAWNMSGVPRSPLKQLRVLWTFTTPAVGSGNQLYVDAIEAS